MRYRRGDHSSESRVFPDSKFLRRLLIKVAVGGLALAATILPEGQAQGRQPIDEMLAVCLDNIRSGEGPEGEPSLVGFCPGVQRYLIKSLKDPDPRTRAWASSMIRRVVDAFVGSGYLLTMYGWKDTQLLVAALADALRDPNRVVQLNAVYTLGEMRDAAARAVSNLIEATNARDEELRQGAVEALASIGEKAFPAVPTLINHLKDQDSGGMRQLSAQALGAIGAGARASIPSLIVLLRDPDPQLRGSAAGALSRIPDSASALLGAMTGPDEGIRWTAAEILINMGPAAKSAVPSLIRILREGDDREKIAAATVLTRIGTKEATASLIELLSSGNPKIRSLATEGLREIGPDAAAAVPALITAVDDIDQTVRLNAIWALSRIGPKASSAVPVLIRVLKASNPELEDHVLVALHNIGPESRAAVPILLKMLEKDALQTYSPVWVLGAIGPAAAAAVPALVDKLKQRLGTIDERTVEHALILIGGPAVTYLVAGMSDPNQAFVIEVESILGQIGPDAKAAVPALVKALDAEPRNVRYGALNALAMIGANASGAVPALVGLVNGSDTEFRQTAMWGLSEMGESATPAIPALLNALRDPDRRIRSVAIDALGKLGQVARPAIPTILDSMVNDFDNLSTSAIDALAKIGIANDLPVVLEQFGSDNSDVRGAIVNVLSQAGVQGRLALPALISELKDRSARDEHFNGSHAAEAIVTIGLAVQERTGDFSIDELLITADTLSQAAETTEDKANGIVNAEALARQMRASRDSLRGTVALRRNTRITAVLKTALGNKTVVSIAAYLTILLFAWSALLLVRPLWLLRIDDALQGYTDVKFPAWLGGMTVPLRDVLLIRFFTFPDRILDSWVNRHIAVCRRAFNIKRTVTERPFHIPVPFLLGDQVVTIDANVRFRPLFEGRACLLIVGEGGSGKTSLACQLARFAMSQRQEERLQKHVMIPILIEHDLVAGDTAANPLLDAIKGQLLAMTGVEYLSDEFLDRLLRRRRIMVIIDHLSELNPDTREKLRPGRPGFPVGALVVTSRRMEVLDDVPVSIIRPLRIQGNRLSSFMEAYLIQRDRRELFDDAEYFDACRGLSVMVGSRNITVLLAKLYAEQMITSKEDDHNGNLPANIPDLMLAYLNELNRQSGPGDPNDRKVQEYAKVVAWECVRENYRPGVADRNLVVEAITDGSPEACIKYLEDRLRLIETVGAARDQIRFGLDPLAEYLGALHLTEAYGADLALWRGWLARVDAIPDSPLGISGFLSAVEDAYATKGRDPKVASFLHNEVAQRLMATKV